GSTSTKISIFENEELIYDKNPSHDMAELAKYERITDQYDLRRRVILDCLAEAGIDPFELDACVGRGGLLRPLSGGTYRVCEKLLADAHAGVSGEHASNLGSILANEIAQKFGKPAYIVDPVVVDELSDVARVSGHPLMPRRSIFHALNSKAMTRRYARQHNTTYADLNVIVAHMGGGVSVSLHNKGRVVDVNNALDGDGPFSPERSGTLPVGKIVELCFSGEHTLKDMKQMIKGKGGLVAYFGSNDMKEIDERRESDPKAQLIIDAFAYQISKEIGSLATVVMGKVDAIILTGGIAFSKYITGQISERTSFIAPVHTYPGEEEMSALAGGALRVLRGEEEAKIY
ncbi:MAG: butyrate kinase, partial [Defluviitaleaceae bacterium]|nr:butyrate kinase [Defluviitaleaceae bacterium]